MVSSPTLKRVQDWIQLPVVFGVVVVSVHFLICECLILMLPQTPTPGVTEGMRRRRSVNVNNWREVEHASFTLVVLSAAGGMAKVVGVFCRRLASCLATKWDQPYSSTMSWF